MSVPINTKSTNPARAAWSSVLSWRADMTDPPVSSAAVDTGALESTASISTVTVSMGVSAPGSRAEMWS